MAIRGALERVTESGVSGWCVDNSTDLAASVDIFVGTTLLGTVRADLPRHDIEKSLHRPFAGFRFPFSPGLFRLLPDGAPVSAVALGEALPGIKGLDARISNPSCPDGSKLLERLGDGYIIGPKSGQIYRPLKGTDLEDRAFEAFQQGNRIFKELFSKQFFICYGTLLGCIRERDFIAHDDDVDVCFLADGNTLTEAAREFSDVVRSLRNRGQAIEVRSHIQFHWRIGGIEVDVFMAWLEDGRLYSYNVGGPLTRDQVCPLRPHEFKGHAVLIPQDPEAVLELIYGPGWRVPDPLFQWRPTAAARAKMREVDSMPTDYLSAGEQIKLYWSNFYSVNRTAIPTSFAASVAVELPEATQIVDIGCGNGRDSLFFALLGHRVLGLDVAEAAISANRRLAQQRGIDGLSFECVDIAAPEFLSAALGSFLESPLPGGSDGQPTRIAAYARFLLHAITVEQEQTLLEGLSAHLPADALCYFEFRTERDAKTNKAFGDHYRRYLHVDRFIRRASRSSAFECVYSVEGRGLAKFRDEDPFVGRVYLRRR